MEQKLQLSFCPCQQGQKKASETDIPAIMIKVMRQQAVFVTLFLVRRVSKSCDNNHSSRIFSLFPWLFSLTALSVPLLLDPETSPEHW
jgi:hypothetical protein